MYVPGQWQAEDYQPNSMLEGMDVEKTFLSLFPHRRTSHSILNLKSQVHRKLPRQYCNEKVFSPYLRSISLSENDVLALQAAKVKA